MYYRNVLIQHVIVDSLMQIDKTLKNLKANDFKVHLVENSKVACDTLLTMLTLNAVIGIGDSATVRQVGVLTELLKTGIKVLNPFDYSLTTDPTKREIRNQIQKEIFNSDILITGTNAITTDGKLVNIDAVGNRVAAMIFGPKKVIIIVGRNKIVEDVEEALYRIKNVIAPYHAKTKDFRTPCAQTGRCNDCSSKNRICNVTTIIERKPWRTEITIILIDEDLGLGWDERWQTKRVNKIKSNYENATWVFTSSFQPKFNEKNN